MPGVPGGGRVDVLQSGRSSAMLGWREMNGRLGTSRCLLDTYKGTERASVMVDMGPVG